MTSLIEMRDITKIYGEGEAQVRALAGISLSVNAGEFLAVMGSSGSGKSTCMNILGCLDVPTSGSFRFKGVEISGLTSDQRAVLRKNHIGFVFQGHNLLPRTSALENVELPLIYRRVPADQRRARAKEALARVGLADRLEHLPSELSGGQMQRVAIARALVSEPALVLADEPTGNLDSQRSVEIMHLLRALNDQGITILMVTHEPDMAAFASRIVQFRDGLVMRDAANDAQVAVGGAA